jgi:hypothetical protein
MIPPMMAFGDIRFPYASWTIGVPSQERSSQQLVVDLPDARILKTPFAHNVDCIKLLVSGAAGERRQTVVWS